ncbi:MAG: hypothetical protein COZ49_03675 [Candidatus Yonathbacteria bacterium CG_4_10_14_3_um_filter_47_65]|uniref:Uncharacterized protein n=1 Tax=Candidatus Yonathbacteria bacterium CG_4_9_14_0_8_um_filter_46_47 TaxID=1975106 RepID=A0A2M8D7T6_9BACT|nr:MAG: hypothetical protein COX54_00175 [Candidatus Yonathbacteria bacterium CG23_combo_of_CG06-09_8_20_14_all_46_18]PIQ31950.1 MAG: hypothetical protein COW61_02840 [Candidatus Yonathbacteria bacterium CG17_big_fil_post_rev_8_21_14_2_50_46_19]PIX56158.1 MAG: hypothetical protein COZ49_03675 [Candidatus Yonathbacteria bacterium CG_4_10_14_3_um_filter_47_65]PJB83213.1 MAG: hypothetical protein CO088_01850 [Candidatus Yonathbacteria bacterium CG_4_9_14_0_8_um_filter_46_47]PJC20776.1 MAG: hypothe
MVYLSSGLVPSYDIVKRNGSWKFDLIEPNRPDCPNFILSRYRDDRYMWEDLYASENLVTAVKVGPLQITEDEISKIFSFGRKV